jgi:SHS family lactate transporter-like MFS transporter
MAMGGASGVIFAMFAESWRSCRRGLVGGVLQAMFIAGTLITQLVLYGTISLLGSDNGWRVGFIGIGAGCLLIAAAAAVWLPESKVWRAARSGQGTLAALRPSRTDRPDRRLLAGAVFLTLCTTGTFAASYSYITFAPTFLRTTAGTSLTTATLVLTVGTLLGVAAYVVAGAASDRFGRRRATAVASAIGVVAFALFGVFGSGGPAAAGVALMGTAIGYSAFGVLGTWISEYFPTRYRAFGAGATYYVARGIGSGLFPLLALWSVGGNLHLALTLGGIGAAVGLLACLFVPDTAGRVISSDR